MKNRELHKRCDGCRKSYPPSDLFPVGDGSIQVCAECYSAATASVLLKGKELQVLKPLN